MRLHSWSVGRAQPLDLGSRERLSRLRCESLLLSLEGHGRRRRRPFGDDGAVDDLFRWTGHAVARRRRITEDAVSGRSHLSPSAYGSCGKLSLIYSDHCPPHRFGACESVPRNDGDTAGRIPIGVLDLRIVSVIASVIATIIATIVVSRLIVVDVYDRRVVDYRIADIHSRYVFATDVIRGHIDFSWPKRKPSDIATATTSTKRNRKAKTLPANKNY